MDDNKRNDYSDFFKRSGENKHNEDELRNDTQHTQERPSYYYSYGPYKSNQNQDADTNISPADQVEMTPPRPIRPIHFNTRDSQQPPMGNWQFEHKKKSSFKSTFAAFMAGAVVVASLMIVSDKMNLFSSASAGTMSAPLAGSGSGKLAAAGGDVKKTSVDLGRPNNISQIVEQASPAVVKIETKVKAKSTGGNSLFNDPFFRQFFGDDFGTSPQNKNKNSDQLQPGGMGSGFIFEKSGYILTNEHVIDGADEIWVTVQGYDQPFKAKLLGNSYDLDLAALKIDNDKEFTTLPLGNPENVSVGDWVVAIGNPYGFDHTVTVGVLSAKERPINIPDNQGTREYKHLLQTDASINPGNSGGPLLNLYGEVIGINTAVSAQAQGIGFAIPTSTISSVLDNLKNNVKIPKEPAPYIGVALQDIDKDWIGELKLDNTEGAIVSQIDRKSPGFKAGLRPYDVILEINGQKIKNSKEVVDKVKTLKVGDKATFGIMRDGKKSDFAVVIGDKNADQAK
ncbi:trypsin-like peptidase domain-containing protein [Paenibacillus thalictri]|uniref:PDZ domain-containing protein n=1 Tax=Paenibacillus thalictri TaxID=2527873 RepID=A0A4Q9DFF5_9BACL|nr:trypsin-like peptidase domain-containing protein [Paenibacillus thalictri]TBL70056.1 PDZ domain-containing protein [Paenibacillus thalictri]